jgi:hypothetical protein
VSEWLVREAAIALPSLPWHPPTYVTYPELAHRWAADLGCDPDAVECAIFQMIADEGDGQRAAGNPIDG